MGRRSYRIQKRTSFIPSFFSWIQTMKFRKKFPPEVTSGILTVSLFAGALFSFFALFGSAGTLGVWLSLGLSSLFGVPKIIFPFLLILLGSMRIRRESEFHWMQGVGLFFFILSFFAFWHLSIKPEEAWSTALKGLGGGLSGALLGSSLQAVVGMYGAIVILGAILISSCLIFFNTSLKTVFEKIVLVQREIKKIRRNPNFVQEKTVVFEREEKEDEKNSGNGVGFPFHFSKKDLFFRKSKDEKTENTDSSEQEKEKGNRKNHEDDIQILKNPKQKRNIHFSLDLLGSSTSQPTSGDIKMNKMIIERTFENFGINVEMGEVHVGPTVTQFTLKPAEGIKLSSITALHNDLALSLAAHPIRIEAPIPGKALVGIEVPNQKTARVFLREILESEEFKKRKDALTLALGKDVSGTPRVAHLSSMPHLLIAGATGSGKTVCMNSLIVSLLYQNTPEELRFIMIDPKRVELSYYNGIPHLLTPVVTDVKKTLNALRWGIKEMERRFDVLATARKKDIASFNVSVKNEDRLPYLVIVIDEMADVMVTAGAEAESLIIRLAQMARAVGIHLVLATQRPSVDVITGLIKANITTRIAFSVASQMDSRTILDTPGAEKLIGRGDMLFLSAELSKPVRIQGTYVSDAEIEHVVEFLKESGEPHYQEEVVSRSSQGDDGSLFSDSEEDAELLEQAKEVLVQAGKASASLLQRRLRIGYARAARILDLLEDAGVIGPADGARPREVYIQSGDRYETPHGDVDKLSD